MEKMGEIEKAKHLVGRGKCKEALEILKAIAPSDPRGKESFAVHLDSIGQLLYTNQAYREAAEVARWLASLYEELGLFPKALKSQYNLLIALKASGQAEEIPPALDHFLELFSKFNEQNEPPSSTLGFVLSFVSYELANSGRLDDAYMVANKAIKILEAGGEEELLIATYITIVRACAATARFAEGAEASYKLRELSQKANDPEVLAYSCLAGAYNEIGLGNWAQAEKLAQEAVDIYVKFQANGELSRAFFVLSLSQFMQQKYNEAILAAVKTIYLNPQDESLVADSLGIIGLCHANLGDWEKAVVYLGEAIQHYVAYGVPSSIFPTLLTVYAQALLVTGRTSGLSTYLKGLEFWIQWGGELDPTLKEYNDNICRSFGVAG